MITVYYAVVMGWCCNYTVFSTYEAWGSDIQKFFDETFTGATKAVMPSTFAGIFHSEVWRDFSWQIFIGSVISWVAIVACIWKGVKTGTSGWSTG